MNAVPHITERDDEDDEQRSPMDVFRDITSVRLPSGPTPKGGVTA